MPSLPFERLPWVSGVGSTSIEDDSEARILAASSATGAACCRHTTHVAVSARASDTLTRTLPEGGSKKSLRVNVLDPEKVEGEDIDSRTDGFDEIERHGISGTLVGMDDPEGGIESHCEACDPALDLCDRVQIVQDRVGRIGRETRRSRER